MDEYDCVKSETDRRYYYVTRGGRRVRVPKTQVPNYQDLDCISGKERKKNMREQKRANKSPVRERKEKERKSPSRSPRRSGERKSQGSPRRPRDSSNRDKWRQEYKDEMETMIANAIRRANDVLNERLTKCDGDLKTTREENQTLVSSLAQMKDELTQTINDQKEALDRAVAEKEKCKADYDRATSVDIPEMSAKYEQALKDIDECREDLSRSQQNALTLNNKIGDLEATYKFQKEQMENEYNKTINELKVLSRSNESDYDTRILALSGELEIKSDELRTKTESLQTCLTGKEQKERELTDHIDKAERAIQELKDRKNKQISSAQEDIMAKNNKIDELNQKLEQLGNKYDTNSDEYVAERRKLSDKIRDLEARIQADQNTHETVKQRYDGEIARLSQRIRTAEASLSKASSEAKTCQSRLDICQNKLNKYTGENVGKSKKRKQ